MRVPTTAAVLLSATLVLVLIAIPAGAGQRPHPHGLHVEGELLVGGSTDATDDEMEGATRGHGGNTLQKLRGIKVHRIRIGSGAIDAVESALRRHPKIRFVERNYLAGGGVVPNDPGYPYQWHFPRISAPTGWQVSTGTSTVPIAIIDSGVDGNHPDLAGKLIPGWNFLGGNTNTSDVLGHGTAVAGTAAATTNDASGVAGLAWKNTIMPLVVLSSQNYATYADIASAITYAADRGVRIMNISIGGSSYSSTLQNAVNYAWSRGAIIAASAMNANTSTPYYPAALTNVLAVAATDQSDGKASFSNYGGWISIAAPGTSIYTTLRGGSYGYKSGTSFASPQVAALAALILSVNPNLTNTEVVALLKQHADDLGQFGSDQTFGAGRINVARALLATPAGTADSSGPAVAITSPQSGATVSGTANVQASAIDSSGVARVELYVDGRMVATDSTAPFTFGWTTTGLTGTHTLSAVAYDTLGNRSSSEPVSVTVASATGTPPTATISGVTYEGKWLTVTASASDSVTRMLLYVDGAWKDTDTSAPWRFRLNARSWTAGAHTLRLESYDASGISGFSPIVTFTK